LNISVQEAEKFSLEEIGRLLEASEGIRFVGVKRAQVYDWIELVLCGDKARGRAGCCGAISRR
jgi:hypothetical protein